MRLFILFLAALTANAADIVARASSGFTTASTWGLAEAGASATQLTRSSNTNTTTSYVYSSAFTCSNTDVIEGLLLRNARLNSTGTVSVALSEDNGTTATREVTVNATDLPLTDPTWQFYKFGSTLTCDGGTDYKVGIKGSSAGNATFYRDGTAGNWTRILRTNQTRTPVAADAMYIAGECTAAATCGVLTVTLNETATTDYGLMDIGQYGVATAGTAAATNYYLRLSGDLNVWPGGTLSLGTTGTIVPAGSTFKLNFDCGSNVQYGLIFNNQSFWNSQGSPVTVRAKLAANAAGGATALTTDVSTGWLNGDEIALASTTRTFSEAEKKTMGANASGTSIGTIAALANAHSGTAPARADLANLTRNVQIFGASASLQSYVLINATATVDVDYTEFYWLGSATALKRGIDVAITTGTVDIRNSSMHNFEVTSSIGVYVNAITSGTFNLVDNVGYLVDAHHFRTGISASPTLTTWVVSGNLYIRNTSSHSFWCDACAGTMSNNTVASSASVGFWLSPSAAPFGTYSGNTAYSCASVGMYIVAQPTNAMTMTNSTVWRNNNWGLGTNAGAMYFPTYPVILDGVTAFGNLTYNVHVGGGVKQTYANMTLNGDTTFATAYGIGVNEYGQYGNLIINNLNAGTASGILTTHSVADIAVGDTASYASITGSNNIMASATPVTINNGMSGFTMGFNKFGGVSGNNKSWIKGNGSNLATLTTDTVIFNTASPSMRMTTSAGGAVYIQSPTKTVAVNSGATVTFGVWVRKSSSGDAGGSNYVGDQPKLMIVTNPAAGIGTGGSDITGGTMTAAVGNWEQLTYTTSAVTENTVLSAYVLMNGTAGWVNVDDWTVTNSQPTGAEKYWFNGGTQLTVPGSGSAAATLAYPMIQ